MASYLVLTPPGGPTADQRTTLFLRDGFSLAAFLFPGIWLLAHRLWIAGVGALVLQGIGTALISDGSLAILGTAVLLAVSMLTSLEGAHLRATLLIRNGWALGAVVTADSIGMAEEIVFSALPAPAAPERIATDWNALAAGPAAIKAGSGPALGLFDLGGR